MVLCIASCRDAPAARPFPPPPTQVELAAALTAIASDDLRLLSVTPNGGAPIVVEDALRYHTRIYSFAFAAEVEVVRRLRVPTLRELASDTHEHGWDVDRIQRQVALRQWLGEAQFEPGQRHHTQTNAIFDETENGWRFRTLSRESMQAWDNKRL